MEAPEKIYLQENTTTDCYDEFWPEWFEARAKDSDIEYVHKDAFIEKIGELLAKMIWEVTYEDLEGDSVQHYDKTEFIEDFKNYLKEE